jgi:hypothetical protein
MSSADRNEKEMLETVDGMECDMFMVGAVTVFNAIILL